MEEITSPAKNGLTTEMRMPRSAKSGYKERMVPSTACLEALYIVPRGMAFHEAFRPIFQMTTGTQYLNDAYLSSQGVREISDPLQFDLERDSVGRDGQLRNP